jgi:hypothetical protein
MSGDSRPLRSTDLPTATQNRGEAHETPSSSLDVVRDG